MAIHARGTNWVGGAWASLRVCVCSFGGAGEGQPEPLTCARRFLALARVFALSVCAPPRAVSRRWSPAFISFSGAFRYTQAREGEARRVCRGVAQAADEVNRTVRDQMSVTVWLQRQGPLRSRVSS
eukprot:4443434-Prymnesium_polylepis.1